MGLGRAPFFPTGLVVVEEDVLLPTTQLVTIIDPETGETTTIDKPITFGPGKAVGVIEEDGKETFKLVGAWRDTGNPHNFLGFQTNSLDNGTVRPIVITARGSVVKNPVVTGGVPLEPGEDVFLSIFVGEVTQNPAYFDLDGAVYYRIGYAVSANKLAISPDFIVRL
tara:strand:- start:902 stop:1402 length:501 start_codon:yes stop_codon:yes gene_type:complete